MKNAGNRHWALWLSLICIIIFILQIAISGFTELFLLDIEKYFEIWRFLTSIFLHGDLAHLLYNLFALALFGSFLEGLIGSRKFFAVFFVTGIIANLIAVNFYPSSLGASGAIFGIIGALIIVRPSLMVWAFGLPMPIFIAGILWAIGDLIGIFVPSNVGNIAHLAGMASGLIMGSFYRDWKERRETRNKERIIIDEKSMRNWEDSWAR